MLRWPFEILRVNSMADTYHRLVTCPGGEMADAPALGAGTRKGVEVQVLSWAPAFATRWGPKIHN